MLSWKLYKVSQNAKCASGLGKVVLLLGKGAWTGATEGSVIALILSLKGGVKALEGDLYKAFYLYFFCGECQNIFMGKINLNYGPQTINVPSLN